MGGGGRGWAGLKHKKSPPGQQRDAVSGAPLPLLMPVRLGSEDEIVLVGAGAHADQVALLGARRELAVAVG